MTDQPPLPVPSSGAARARSGEASNVPRLDQLKGRSILDAPKVRALLDAMVVDGLSLRDAAKAAGVRQKRARLLMRNPAVRKAFFAGIEELREHERARNIHLAAKLRDDGFGDVSAAHKKVALEAARYLDGAEERGGITITGGQNVIAGYVIKLDGPAVGPAVIARHGAEQANPLIEHDDVGD